MRDIQTRTSRSDEGVLSLTNAIFKDILGLTPETSSRVLKLIKNQGEWQDLKVSVRRLSGVAHRRLNDVINMAREASTDIEGAETNGDEGWESGFGPEDEIRSLPPEEMTRESLSFAGFLLNELQYSDEDLRDPKKRQDIMRMMRASDSQAEQLTNRAEREQKQSRRKEIASEQDPKRAQLLRKKQNLQRQIQMIDQELEQVADK